MADDITTGTPSGGTTGTTATSGTSAASTPITLTEQSSFIPPGGKDPVTWKDFSSGYVSKADYTRQRQEETARQNTERTTWQQQERQRIENEYRERYQQQTQTQQGAQQAGQFLEGLRARPYLSGAEAAGIVEQTIIPMANALMQSRQEAQQAINLLQQQVQQMRQSVGGFTTEYQQTKWNGLMTQTKANLSLPNSPVVDELLQDVYHSYTGWESDPAAFERTVGDRWKGIVEAIRAEDRRRADEARRQPFTPGQPGGVARVSRPALKGNETPEQMASRLWDGLQPVNT